jgi:hypothetical protein
MDFLDEYSDYEPFDTEEDDAEEDFEGENYINRTFVCEECDFRWREKIYPDRNDYPDYEDELGGNHYCPQCGSMNVSFY